VRSVSSVRSWTVIVPVKLLDEAKSRLDRPDRADVALAVAVDTVAAAAACSVVDAVVVVTDDPRASAALTGLAEIVADEPAGGLNAALVHGAEVAARQHPGTGVVALAADLPALRPDQLGLALAAAEQSDVALVSDAAGHGTVLLAAAPGRPLEPHFGPGSRAAHVRAGATDLTDRLGTTVPGLRRDVDTVADLAAAAALGVGPATRALARSHATVQATVTSWDAATASGSAVTDAGSVVELPAGTRLAGLRGLRRGQRVRVVRNGQECLVALVTGHQ
jgi:2-phospho-L-lactate guanylyltransferase